MSYPRLNTLLPDELLSVAERYLARCDFGAALYYGGFAVAVANVQLLTELSDADNRSWNGYFVRALAVIEEAGSGGFRELELMLEGSSINITDKNKEVLLREHSPHWTTFEQLYKMCDEYSFT